MLIARQLLTDDGVLYVSCNDIEQANLRLLLNEVFGEENHAATLIWNNEGNIDNQSRIKVNHEYILMYVRDLEKFRRPGVIDPNVEESSKLYRDVLENTIVKNGPANPASTLVLPAGFPAAFEEGEIPAQTESYPYLHDTGLVEKSQLTEPVRIESGWSSANLLKLFVKNGLVPIQDAEGKETRFALHKTGAIYSYKTRAEDQGHVLSVIRNVGTTKQNSARLARWGLDFDYPKPVMLISYLCQIATDEDDIVMDLFAGSGTTAESVMRLNRDDGGRRRFIMVQLPELTDEKSKPRKAGYTNIAAMGKERVRKAADELRSTPLVEENQSAEDVGFRVFRLMPSHFKPWQGVPAVDAEEYEATMEMFSDPLIGKWDAHQVIYEVAMHEGFELDLGLAEVEGPVRNMVWRVAERAGERAFLICLDASLDAGTAEALNLSTDDLFVCRDAALTDTLAANLSLQCRLRTL